MRGKFVKYASRRRRGGSELHQTLALAGMTHLAANTTYMLYPNHSSRGTGNRHYFYSRTAGWTDTGVSLTRTEAKYDLINSALETIGAGQLGRNGRLEPQKTNSIPANKYLAFENWSVYQAINVVTGRSDPFGGTDARLISANGQGDTEHAIFFSSSGLSNQCFSIFAKSDGSHEWIRIRYGAQTKWASFNIKNGSIGLNNGGCSIRNIGGGWFQCCVYSEGDLTSPVILLATQDGTGFETFEGTTGVYLYWSQLEELEYASSFPVGGSTYSSDALRGIGLSGMASAGGLCFMLRLPYASTLPSSDLYHIGLNGANSKDDGIFCWTDASAETLIAEVISGGVSQGTVDLGAVSADTQYAIALSWDSGGLSAAINGVEKTATGAITVPTSIDRVEFGRGISTDTAHGGEIPLSIGFNRALTSAERAALSGSAFKTSIWTGL